MAEASSMELFATELESQVAAAQDRLRSAETTGDELLAEVERQHLVDLERLAEANDIEMATDSVPVPAPPPEQP